MKKNSGLIFGFIIGALVGFLAIYVMSRLHPGEDFAGVFIITLFCSGCLFAVVGTYLQRYFNRRKI